MIVTMAPYIYSLRDCDPGLAARSRTMALQYGFANLCSNNPESSPPEDRSLSALVQSCRIVAQTISFLALPGELRNEIYYHILNCAKEQRLKLRMRNRSDGIVVVQESVPLLGHALPELREEIISIYYSINTFHVCLTSPERRQAFRLWIQERGNLLKDFKTLRLVFTIRRQAWKENKTFVKIVSSSFRVIIDEDDHLNVQHDFDRVYDCGLCSPGVYQRRDQEEMKDDVVQSIARGIRDDDGDREAISRVFRFSLGLSDWLDVASEGEVNVRDIPWLRAACWREKCTCGLDVKITVP